MSEHPTRFRIPRYCVLGSDLYGWFIFDNGAIYPHSLDETYKTQAEAKAVCKLMNAAEGE